MHFEDRSCTPLIYISLGTFYNYLPQASNDEDEVMNSLTVNLKRQREKIDRGENETAIDDRIKNNKQYMMAKTNTQPPPAVRPRSNSTRSPINRGDFTQLSEAPELAQLLSRRKKLSEMSESSKI